MSLRRFLRCRDVARELPRALRSMPNGPGTAWLYPALASLIEAGGDDVAVHIIVTFESADGEILIRDKSQPRPADDDGWLDFPEPSGQWA